MNICLAAVSYTHLDVYKRQLTALQSYSWPGNVRQLENTIEQLVAVGEERKSVTESEVTRILARYAASGEHSPQGRYNFTATDVYKRQSELFGYAPGAFTGAGRSGKPGLFEVAHRGTIFLDEIGEMSGSLQARLLRVLQERETMRVGGVRVIPIDVRVIAATNKDLFGLVQKPVSYTHLDVYKRQHNGKPHERSGHSS